MKKHEVIAEFVDVATGERNAPARAGEEPVMFTPRDDDQAARLIAAGCLRDPDGKTKAVAAEATVGEKINIAKPAAKPRRN